MKPRQYSRFADSLYSDPRYVREEGDFPDLAQAIVDEVEDIIRSQEPTVAAQSVLNLIIDTKYEW